MDGKGMNEGFVYRIAEKILYGPVNEFGKQDAILHYKAISYYNGLESCYFKSRIDAVDFGEKHAALVLHKID